MPDDLVTRHKDFERVEEGEQTFFVRGDLKIPVLYGEQHDLDPFIEKHRFVIVADSVFTVAYEYYCLVYVRDIVDAEKLLSAGFYFRPSSVEPVTRGGHPVLYTNGGAIWAFRKVLKAFGEL